MTTKEDDYFIKFYKLSKSGHDLTPMNANDLKYWREKVNDSSINHYKPTLCETELYGLIPYLGQNCKGLYVGNIGGLPLFSSGYIIESLCDNRYLYFEEPCDNEHVLLENDLIYDARSRTNIGSIVFLNYKTRDGNYYSKHVYKVKTDDLKFIDIKSIIPVESRPENFWGTEGQFTSWNENEGMQKPLSY